MAFLISALRSVIELVGLCLLGQGTLYLILGGGACRNPIYRAFAFLTLPPRQFVRLVTQARKSDGWVSAWTFVLLLFFWLGLAWVRKFI